MAFPDRQTLDLHHGRVSYRQAGSGPDLVLLHGLAGNSRTWEEQFAAFSGRWRVTAWDAPGYGESDTVEPTVDAYAAALAALVDALELPRFVLLGHSMGGVVAGRFAGTYPERLRALALSCTLLGRRQAPGTPLSEPYLARLRELETLPAREYGANRAKSMAAPGCAPEILERLTGIAAETRREGLESAMRLIAVADNSAALASLILPVLVLTGQEDRTVTKEVSGDLLAALAGGPAQVKTKELPGVGHAPYLEDTAAYNSALQAFLDDL
ncbi:alpha/beta hydrolase [Thalassobaculum sp. OXR-137]|uniref:alpha/beta fold hydrolase n=1 Tax=Thalassobaculum sp. OXR-137 TaxID=3100173 RepID=UPI002AC9993E|nr:alpha/beta hydrolase [Thalassobaculum sp. OXR-137]WPZ36596.1 alpha/beta hydrolase [Thalassobaculum sp. OXR-137]